MDERRLPQRFWEARIMENKKWKFVTKTNLGQNGGWDSRT